MNRRRLNGDDGTGLIATFAGLLVFLVLLLFAVQTLIAAFARSSATDAAYEGARLVAGARTPHDESALPETARVRAEQIVRSNLGRFGADVDLDWTATTWDTVALTIRARPPGFMWTVLGAVAPSTIERTARVRVERWQ
ncbi:MAG: hypothetical protein FGM58_11030 [Acidimicrobiia bacterium]|nr:hypothetical protein [Acidimicrobiia bacterium]